MVAFLPPDSVELSFDTNKIRMKIMSDDIMCSDVYETSAGYQTCDLYLAALFLSAGCKMSKALKDQRSKRVSFQFEKNVLMAELKMKYFAREAKIDALSFADNIKSLKSLCHNILNSQGN
jgi:hypothetical protein